MIPRATPDSENKSPDINPLKVQVQARIRKLELLTSSGLWILALFTALSIGAYQDFGFLPSLSEKIHALLGSGPPVNFINWALVLYGFAGIIMVLTQMTSSKRPQGALSHFGYLSAFYTFYHFAGGLTENFWAVFTVGMTILSLQSYHVWDYYKEKVRAQEEILAELNKLEED